MDLRLDSEIEGGQDLIWSYLLDLSFSIFLLFLELEGRCIGGLLQCPLQT